MKKNLFLIISAMFFIVQNAYAQTNSYNMLAKPLTDLISMKYSDQTEEVVKAVKKEKDYQLFLFALMLLQIRNLNILLRKL